jgi:hypothetical protein
MKVPSSSFQFPVPRINLTGSWKLGAGSWELGAGKITPVVTAYATGKLPFAK